MKKLMVLMFVSFLTLAGCGGGGGGDITAGIPGVPDESPNVISNPVVDPVAGPMGRITVNFEPQETPRALISSTGWIRNHARLVVRQFGEVEIPGAPIYGELICDDEVPDDCSRSIDGYQPSTFEYKEIPNTKKISDSALNPDGSGSVSIAVPPGAGYTLEILTYFSDKTGKNGANEPPSGLNFMMQYAKNHDGTPEKTPITFTINPGEETDVFVTLDSALAQLNLPAGPVLANTTYPVSVTKNDALRDAWKVLQTLDENDRSSEWFTATTGDLGVSGTGAITLTAPLKSTPSGGADTPSWQLWHHGQFFISDHMLGYPNDDPWSKWTFGTSNAGLINPLGSIIVNF